jgi:alginate O-acetyltransferase complex protein AlgI
VLFNSHVFIFAFLPLCLIGYGLAGRTFGGRAAMAFLAMASLGFYGWWNPMYVPLIIALMTANYGLGTWLGRIHGRGGSGGRLLLTLGITANLGVLCWFKYANFLIDSVRATTGADLPLLDVVLPLGISFFTFQKIAYLVDSYRGATRGYGFVDYSLFVLFFPQLIAGPIVHHKDVVPQFERADGRLTASDLSAGLTIFAIGLFKKAILADSIAPDANLLFASVHQGVAAPLVASWVGALAYTLQLYFDFSGYSDMAIGLARMFGIRLPANFDSPYKATNIVEFWRRWHMTLSRFLRDYLYVALGGNRKGPVRRYANLLTTMLLGGLWHGAGWTFVFWGLLHGLYLCINHGWRHMTEGMAWASAAWMRPVHHLVTLLAVIVGWVFFRAASFSDATTVLGGMIGLHGVGLPARFEPLLARVAPLLPMTYDPIGAKVASIAWIVVLAVIALVAPNTQQIMAQVSPVLDMPARTTRLQWSRSLPWAAATGGIVLVGLLSLGRVSEFLYFQF